MFKTIFLDADDTVFNFDMAQKSALRATFEKLGYPFTDELYKLYDSINIKYWKMLERGETTKEKLIFDRFIELYEKTGINGDVEATEEEYQSGLGKQAFWWSGARSGVEYLSKKYRIFITTNGHGDTQTNRVKLSGLDKYISGLFISENIGFAKPSREYFDYCLKHSGANKEDVLVIGDSLTSDIRGGINAGLKTMWFNPDNQSNPDFFIDYIVHSWEEIINIL